MQDIAISVESVSKFFKLPHEKQSSLKGLFLNIFRGKRTYEKQKVLDNVSFNINKGEFFGIVGRNGSGKSTLLKMLAGVYSPNEGNIHVNGKLTPFIELGVGFNPELSGKENVFLNGALLGFDRKEMSTMYNEIVEFAELEKFMDQKLKNYSSGMQVRLAFSIAIRAKTDILLLDEVLAVGDANFQKKCFDYFRQLKREKKTVVFVSHDAGALEEYCTNGLLLEKGHIVKIGKIGEVVKDYNDILHKSEEAHITESESNQWGTGEVIVKELNLTGKTSNTKIYQEGETIGITATFEATKDVDEPVFGITITDLAGVIVFQSNTLWCKKSVSNMEEGHNAVLQWKIPNVFNTGTYLLAPAVSDKTGTVVYDWRDDYQRIKVVKSQKSHALINIEHVLTYKYE